ncbi:uncharacterized protein PFL1_04922 [Pseudozyma flocculosa PF-1]|uniref:UDENN domain-containing protein n=2 Tax=Pseudozyma flocculosa TaxID=84751 RepID=A0A5C3EWG3_9BASI|nr:uncharacterized protein PFL1_04922 [Pseudozyma flocculosa PF-1]EPQ27383.1 hypothetical protein PFL1_04922 [Pseudozyma flocculosa PF-1]SPO36200.1 uncharacterized protein PSFLO_01671 [Pseudozyma flocculosa]
MPRSPPSSVAAAGPTIGDSRRLSSVNDGDLGLFGLSSPSPPHSTETFSLPSSSSPVVHPTKLSAPARPSSSRPGSASSTGAGSRRLSTRLGQLQGNGSATSLHTSYYSAEESAGFSPNASAAEDSPAQQKAEIGPAPGSTLSREPLSIDSGNSRPGSASKRQAMSIAEETELNPPLPPASPRGSRPRAKKASSSSRSRMHLPPPEERLPVGAGGPSAPPRSASVRSFGRRSSIGGGSNQGHGDLGSGLMPGIRSQMSMVGSPVLPTTSPSLGGATELEPSPRPSFSSAGRSLPDRSASLPASSSASSRVASPTSPQAHVPTTARGPSAAQQIVGGGVTEAAALPEEPTLDREAMQRWVLSVGCVTFDLELGPDLEFLYPPLGISREERDNIAFSSFPDTSIFDDGSSVFSWRVREVPLDSSQSEPPTIRGLSGTIGKQASAAAAAAALDDKTPRPSITRTLSQSTMQSRGPNAEAASTPTSPLASNGSRGKDALSPTMAGGKGIARHASDANLQASSSGATSSFRETLTSRLFPNHGNGGHSSGSSTSSTSRFSRHERKASASSTGSTTSADDEPDLASQVAALQTGEISMVASSGGSKAADALLPKRTGTSTSSSYIYGYVFFRQKRDPTSRRGYFQKSVVILSHLPFVGLFSEVVSRLGPLYFEHGMAMFEAFANDIISWPSPQPGSVLTLPLLGSILTAAIPFGQQAQNSPNAELYAPSPASPLSLRNTATMTIRSRSRSQQGNRELPEPLIGPGGPLLASIPGTSLFDTFKEGLADLWLLWECVLLAEPILVIGPDPKVVSEAVWHMLDLIRPIPYAGDFRPYFHIHDYDFRTLVTKNKPQAGTLIGATNPFLATACSHWPHLLRVGKAAVKVGSGFKHGSAPPTGSGTRKVGGGHGAGGGGPDHVPGFITKRKRRVSKDRVLLKRLLDLASSSQPSSAERKEGNVAMRRYFADLTERFLAPLNRYVASLVPATFDLGSPSEAPKIRPFNTTAFLASLKAHGTPIPLRSRSLPTGANIRIGLYLDFLKCPNFSLWLHSRVAAAEEEQRRRYIAALVQGDVTTFGNTKGEIETIDLYSRIVEEIRLVDVQLTAPTEPGPGSRWRTDTPTTSPSSTVDSAAPSRDHHRGATHSSAAAAATGSNSSGRSTPTAASSSSATSWPTTEKRLVEQKRRLLDQLDRLCETLPDDLKTSLKRPA